MAKKQKPEKDKSQKPTKIKKSRDPEGSECREPQGPGLSPQLSHNNQMPMKVYQTLQPPEQPFNPQQHLPLCALHMIPCTPCLTQHNINKTFTGYTSLSHHYDKKHPDSPKPTRYEGVREDGRVVVFMNTGRGRPKKGEMMEGTKLTSGEVEERERGERRHDDIIDFIQNLLQRFCSVVETDRQRRGEKGEIRVEEYAVLYEALGVAGMWVVVNEVEKQVLQELIDKQQRTVYSHSSTISTTHFLTTHFLTTFFQCIKEFIEQVSFHSYQDFTDPLNIDEPSSSSSDPPFYVDENDLQQLLGFQRETQYFLKSSGKWQQLMSGSWLVQRMDRDNNKEKLRVDMVVIAWLSGVVRKDLLEEYVSMVLEREFARLNEGKELLEGEIAGTREQENEKQNQKEKKVQQFKLFSHADRQYLLKQRHYLFQVSSQWGGSQQQEQEKVEQPQLPQDN